MKYALVFSLMSAALVGGVVVDPAWAILKIWAALSFGLVALGYAGVGARIFCKRVDGRILWVMKILLLPYLGYTWIVWHLYRVLSREDAFNCVDDDLVVGRRLLAGEVPGEFDHYVDLTAEFEEPTRIRSKASYHSLPILDAGIPDLKELDRVVELVKGGRTFVHCAQGHGRTGLFALALLVRRGGITSAKGGIELLQHFRPGIGLNRAQSDFIERYVASKNA